MIMSRQNKIRCVIVHKSTEAGCIRLLEADTMLDIPLRIKEVSTKHQIRGKQNSQLSC